MAICTAPTTCFIYHRNVAGHIAQDRGEYLTELLARMEYVLTCITVDMQELILVHHIQTRIHPNGLVQIKLLCHRRLVRKLSTKTTGAGTPAVMVYQDGDARVNSAC